ncbi:MULTISPECIES: GNAT family N-acetyltransferase [unclassified Paenibacillus]
MVHCICPYGEICIIVVGSSAKRRGIGRQLMNFAERGAEL